MHRIPFLPPLEVVAKQAAKRTGVSVDCILGREAPPDEAQIWSFGKLDSVDVDAIIHKAKGHGAAEAASRPMDDAISSPVVRPDGGCGMEQDVAGVGELPALTTPSLDDALEFVIRHAPQMLAAVERGEIGVVSLDPQGVINRLQSRGFQDNLVHAVIPLFQSDLPGGHPWMSHRVVIALADRNLSSLDLEGKAQAVAAYRAFQEVSHED